MGHDVERRKQSRALASIRAASQIAALAPVGQRPAPSRLAWPIGFPLNAYLIVEAIDRYCTGQTRVDVAGKLLSPNTNDVLQALGLTIEKWARMPGQERIARVWRAVTNVDLGADPDHLKFLAVSIIFKLDHATGEKVVRDDIVCDPVQYAPLTNGPVLVSDACQGMYPDCYFIAALASVAWTNPRLISSQMASAMGDSVTIRLYSDDPIARGPARLRSGRNFTVPLKSESSILRMKSGNPPLRYDPYGASGRDARVSWASAFELAKYGWEANVDRVDRCPDLKSWLSPSLRNMRTATVQIDGGAPQYWVQVLGSDVWGELSRICDSNGIITRAMVAATLPEPFLTMALGADDQLVNHIVAAHVYSVLGKIEESGRRCVVLRNPWGRHPMRGRAVLPNGRSWNTLALGMDGVFAIDFDAFVTIFDGGTMYGST